MKVALPRGMFRRGGKLWARKDVPKPLREIIGQTSLQQTLGTGDVYRARVLSGFLRGMIVEWWFAMHF